MLWELEPRVLDTSAMRSHAYRLRSVCLCIQTEGRTDFNWLIYSCLHTHEQKQKLVAKTFDWKLIDKSLIAKTHRPHLRSQAYIVFKALSWQGHSCSITSSSRSGSKCLACSVALASPGSRAFAIPCPFPLLLVDITDYHYKPRAKMQVNPYVFEYNHMNLISQA